METLLANTLRFNYSSDEKATNRGFSDGCEWTHPLINICLPLREPGWMKNWGTKVCVPFEHEGTYGLFRGPPGMKRCLSPRLTSPTFWNHSGYTT